MHLCSWELILDQGSLSTESMPQPVLHPQLLLCTQQAVHGHLSHTPQYRMSILLVGFLILILKIETTKSAEKPPFVLRLHQT